jgi:hypothetical protein
LVTTPRHYRWRLPQQCPPPHWRPIIRGPILVEMALKAKGKAK